MAEAPDPIAEEAILWVRWNAAVRSEHGWLEQAIVDFDPGPRPAAQAAALWLREHGLGGESQPYLAVVDRSIAGFYALTVGQVVLSSGQRKIFLENPGARQTASHVLKDPIMVGRWALEPPAFIHGQPCNLASSSCHRLGARSCARMSGGPSLCAGISGCAEPRAGICAARARRGAGAAIN